MKFKPYLLSHLLDTPADETEIELERADDKRDDDIEREIERNENQAIQQAPW